MRDQMKKIIDLKDCIQEFSEVEQLSENDEWYCPKCKSHRRAYKKMDLFNIPEILIIHLKRFTNHKTFREKITAVVDFPIEKLDLTPFLLQKFEGECIYELYATSVILNLI
jgi:ubiquitin carboxyl-terminal hydrolase 4/11